MADATTFKDPYAGFRFKVKLGGNEIGGVSEVSGIKSKTDFDRVREGGNNLHEHSMLKPHTYPELLTLKKMFFQDSNDFYELVKGVHGSSSAKKDRIGNVELSLLDQTGAETGASYTFSNCVAVEFEGPTFNAKGGELSVESIKLWYDYFEFTKGK